MSEYYDKWYQENKDKLSERRKKRYREDPEYRRKTIERSKKYRSESRNRVANVSPVARAMRRSVTVERDGSEITFHTVGVVSAVLNRESQSVVKWERLGVIPKTPYRRGGKSVRYYTMDMIEAIRDVVGKKTRIFKSDRSIPEGIEKRWRELGVPIGFEGEFDAAVEATDFKAAS